MCHADQQALSAVMFQGYQRGRAMALEEQVLEPNSKRKQKEKNKKKHKKHNKHKRWVA
jgi:hypothetical protein